MNLNVKLLRAMGVPENLLTAATAPRNPLFKEKPAKLDINFLDPRERSLWDILCFLKGDKPTLRARRVVKDEMRRMAAEADAQLAEYQALISGSDSGAGGPAGKAAKGLACHASAARPKSKSPSR